MTLTRNVVWFLLITLLTTLSVSAQEVKKNRPELVVPPRIYAVPGVETNVYFSNITRTVNPANFDFDVTCSKGRNDVYRWRFTPSPDDVGTYKWNLTVYNDEGPTAICDMELVVTGLDAAKDRKISWLHLGDSISASGVISGRVRELAQKHGPTIKSIGSLTSGKTPVTDKTLNLHEGRPGWTSGTFLGKTSPFFFDGKIDFKRYLNEKNDGKAPDVVTIMLGANSMYGGTEATRSQVAQRAVDDAMTLVAMIRALSADTIIGITTCAPGADQDAFGTNYKCNTTSWQYKKNCLEYDKLLIKRVAELKDPKVSICANAMNLDTVNCFPRVSEPVNAASPNTKVSRLSNGLHPIQQGAIQYGDFIYCWMKAVLNKPAPCAKR